MPELAPYLATVLCLSMLYLGGSAAVKVISRVEKVLNDWIDNQDLRMIVGKIVYTVPQYCAVCQSVQIHDRWWMGDIVVIHCTCCGTVRE